MNFPGKLVVSKPLIAAVAVIAFFYLATMVFAQGGGSVAERTSLEDVFRYVGWFLLVFAVLAIAAGTVYNTIRKAAMNEWKELAEARKGKLTEKELENEKLRARVKDLEFDNESLEKKNLRLQNETK